MNINAQKIIVSTEDVELDIGGVTLLSIEEAKKLPITMRKCEDPWWLRSQGHREFRAAFVDGEDGFVDAYGTSVSEKFGIRPALVLSNLKLANFQIADKVKLFDYTWTLISENLALCDETVGKCKFREGWKALDANNYKVSDVKKWLEEWYTDRCNTEARANYDKRL